MKKFAMLLAAGVVAFGASAQAAPVESSTYAVITVPLYPGNNLIGVSATPMGDNPTLATALGISASTNVKKLNADGKGYTSTEAGSETAFGLGDAYWVPGPSNSATNMYYEIGTSPTTTNAIVAYQGLTPAVVTIPFAWHLKDCNLVATDTTSRKSTAAKVHVWNPATQSYDAYWLKKTSTGVQWMKGSTNADDVVINPAQGFFFELLANKNVLITPTPVVAQ